MNALGFLVFAAAIALAIWTARELASYTFKNAREKKPFIIGFALAGLVIASVFVVATQLWEPQGPVPSCVPILILVLCPPALLNVVFLDVPHPPVTYSAVAWTLTALMNSALYAAIGGRVGAYLGRRESGKCQGTIRE